MELHRIEGAAEVVPVEGADESLIAIAEDLTADGDVQVLGPDLDVGLAQVDGVIAFCSHHARFIGTVGVEFEGTLPLHVEAEVVGGGDLDADPGTLEEPGVVGQGVNAVVEVEVVLPVLEAEALLEVKGDNLGLRRRDDHGLGFLAAGSPARLRPADAAASSGMTSACFMWVVVESTG